MNLLHIALAIVLAMTNGQEFPTMRSGIYDVVQGCMDGPYVNDSLESSVRLMTVIAYRESAFRENAVGDNGKSLGMMQLNAMWGDREDLLDGKKSVKIALRLIKKFTKRCGSTRAGIGAYMTGVCDGAPKKTKDRCLAAGIGENCNKGL